MKQAGQIVLFRFPYVSGKDGKLRPALLLGKLLGDYDDWLICMISSQLRQAVPGFDEVIVEEDADFLMSGLKIDSVIRIGRVAVVQSDILVGAIGHIAQERLLRIKKNWADWFEKAG